MNKPAKGRPRSASFPEGHGIGEDEVRRRLQSLNGPNHRQPRSLVDVHGINFFGAYGNHLKADGLGANFKSQRFAALRGELLGIVKAGDRSGGIEDYRRGVERTKQSAAPRLVATRHISPSAAVSLLFKPPRALEVFLVSYTRHGQVIGVRGRVSGIRFQKDAVA